MANYVSQYRKSDWSGRGKGPLFRPINRRGSSPFAEWKRQLAEFPLSLAHDIASRAAPALTRLAQGAYDSGVTVYGESRPTSKAGTPLTLKDTGDTRRTVRFVSNGTIVRCVLPTKYAKYLIGKYGILPNGGLPISWDRELSRLVDTATRIA